MAEIISVRFRSEGKQYYFDPQGMTFHAGDGVIVETAGGIEYAKCIRGNFHLDESELTAPLRPVIRPATPEDEAIVERNREKEKYAFKVCQEKILEHELDMKLVSVEYSFEGTKILFFFTSEGRVDFRALVKSLAAIFHTRIELRQIGIRDEAKMLGGLGICGRPFCCNSFLREFQPVSIKMAKTQNLSLNPTKISGTCGRLMCCLKYEQEAYEDLMKDAPRADSFVETPDGAGNIITVNTLRETVRVRLDNEPDSLKTYHNSEIRVVRSGKGKRPDDYVEPPKEELEKLRKVTISPEEQYRREQAALAAALDEFMSERTSRGVQEPAHQEPAHGSSRRRRGGDKGRNAEKAEKALEADVEREKEKQEQKSRRNRGRGKKEGAKEAAPVVEPVKEPTPADGKKEGGSRRRHRGSRGSHSTEKAQKQGQQPNHQQQAEKPKKQSTPQKPSQNEGKAEGGEGKKGGGRPRWNRRGPRKPGGGNKPAGE
ncbi:MAG: stage 0 sporulation family protein [Ruminiclostridium sp.]|nr:stage 0 sporulation family protein [Ruminiclostridium sp.]